MMMFNDANSPSCGDYFTIAPHGMVVTHMDALCHFSWKDRLYNGRYQPNEYVTVADFEAAEKRQRVRVGAGDAIFVRTGMERMETKLGEQDVYPRAGLHAECVEWMHDRQVSVYGGDCIEKLPYPSESFTSAVHMIVLASMGLPILDWPSLTELARTCERLGRWGTC